MDSGRRKALHAMVWTEEEFTHSYTVFLTLIGVCFVFLFVRYVLVTQTFHPLNPHLKIHCTLLNNSWFWYQIIMYARELVCSLHL